jgi:hypothetical protein
MAYRSFSTIEVPPDDRQHAAYYWWFRRDPLNRLHVDPVAFAEGSNPREAKM